MILQIRIYLISILYIWGALFMILFPPRNFKQSGAKVRKARSVECGIKYTSYVNHSTLMAVASRISTDDPEIVRLVYLDPKTYQNRSIVSIELRSDPHSRKPGVLIIGGLNGMVWGAPNAILELMEKLLYDSKYQTPFFNDYDWFLIPIANPDGLALTQEVKELPPVDAITWSTNLTVRSLSRPAEWLKNIEKTQLMMPKHTCHGTMINRNFAYHWQDDVSTTPNVCSQYYPGEKPFSTAEAQAIRRYVDNLANDIHFAIHLDASFKHRQEYILYPWRYTTRQQSNYALLQAIGEYAARQARQADGRLYEVHQSSHDGRAAGTFSDYVTGVVGTELVFLVKPYHKTYPNYSDFEALETYVTKSISTILSLVRGWRSSNKQNTLSFFGKEVEF